MYKQIKLGYGTFASIEKRTLVITDIDNTENTEECEVSYETRVPL